MEMVSAAHLEISAASAENAAAAFAPPKSRAASSVPEPSLVSVATLVAWISCAVVGSIGLAISYPQLAATPAPSKPVHVEILNVELTSEPMQLAPLAATPPPLDVAKPDEIKPIIAPSAPPLVAVAEPSRVEFALPVRGPVQVVEPARASVSRPAEQKVEPTTTAKPVAAPQQLQYGYGEGKQPRPDYPLYAQRTGQEGTVTVRFTVAENGRVLTAEAVDPSPWPLLNDAAVRAVRERWRFLAGPARVYDVAIRFELKNKKS